MKSKNTLTSPRSLLCIGLVICYAAGMVCMLLDAFPIGLMLWAISTVGGLGALHWIRVSEEKTQESEDDQPCE